MCAFHFSRVFPECIPILCATNRTGCRTYIHIIPLRVVARPAKPPARPPTHQLNKFREKENSIELEMERGDGEFFDPSLVSACVRCGPRWEVSYVMRCSKGRTLRVSALWVVCC